MKKFFSGTEFKVLLLILLVISVGLIGFYGYNEYTYRKVGICISEGNYKLASNYMDGVSSSYKDMRKIRSLLDIIDNIDYNNSDDITRAYSKLEALKGFKSENVNYVYNSLVLSLYQKLCVTEIYSAAIPVALPDVVTLPTTTNATIPTTAAPTTTSGVNSKPTSETTVYFTESTTETEIFTTEPTTVFSTTGYSTTTLTTQSTTEYTTTRQTTVRETTTSQAQHTGTVYYVESGEVYHISADCRTLARSTNILSGPIPEGRRACKVCG